MNEVIRNIDTRVSVRDYKDEKVPDETIKELLRLGCRAPSSMNRQALAFAIVEDKEKAKIYSDRAKSLRIEGEKMKSNPSEAVIDILSDEEYNIFFNSPVQIFIFCSPEGLKPTEDGSFAAQNICLAAHSMGYGTCTIGFAQGLGRDPEFRKDLGVPGDYSYVGALTLGKPAGETDIKPRKETNILSWIR